MVNKQKLQADLFYLWFWKTAVFRFYRKRNVYRLGVYKYDDG